MLQSSENLTWREAFFFVFLLTSIEVAHFTDLPEWFSSENTTARVCFRPRKDIGCGAHIVPD